MSRSSRYWRMTVLVLLTALCAGCGGPDKPDNGKEPADKPTNGDNGQAKIDVPPEVEPPPPPPTIPKTVFDDATARTNLVKQDGQMPEGKLPDLDGRVRPIKELYGEKLTVVVFWREGESTMQTLQELQDLGSAVVEPYAGKGVAVVTVNVGDSPEKTRQALETAEAKLPVLLDTNGAFFAKVATGKLPRTYVLDVEGRILWFDTEYSESALRDMIQTIRVALGEIGGP